MSPFFLSFFSQRENARCVKVVVGEEEGLIPPALLRRLSLYFLLLFAFATEEEESVGGEKKEKRRVGILPHPSQPLFPPIFSFAHISFATTVDPLEGIDRRNAMEGIWQKKKKREEGMMRGT